MTRRTLLVLASLLVAACGASAAEIQKAKTSAYNTEFARVWTACDTELKERFHEDGLRIEDAERGIIETKWEPIEASSESVEGVSDQTTNRRAGVTMSRIMWRMFVKILPGGPPWRISVDGEAALYRSNMSMLTPYKHGAIDEPQWVPDRIDGIILAIHNRLKEYAVTAPPAAPAETAPPAAPAETAPPAAPAEIQIPPPASAPVQ